jgi:hypothetical protein
MADVALQSEGGSRLHGSMEWSAVWAGLFTFAAIWSIFEILGFAIFASAGVGESFQHMGYGMGIWTIVLTIIAMWVAGLETAKLARLEGRGEGAMHGMVMFGLAVAGVLVLLASGGMLFAGNTVASAHNAAVLNSSEWIGFLSLLLGWLAAMAGGASGVKVRRSVSGTVQDIRTAA